MELARGLPAAAENEDILVRVIPVYFIRVLGTRLKYCPRLSENCGSGRSAAAYWPREL